MESNSPDEERTVEQVNRNLKKRQQQSLTAQSVQQTIQCALEQDSSVFQYDEVYDSMKEKEHRKVEERRAADRSSRYAADLIREAEKRKVRNELRVERSVQKERQAEGSQFADKESFVTESYKKKLTERAEMEREIKRDEMLEARRNKTQEFSGFYRSYLDKVCRDGSEKLEVQDIDENGEEEVPSGKLEQADSLADIKTGGLILPSKKRPANIRKRLSEDKKNRHESNVYESSDDEENAAPASKIREIQTRQYEGQRVKKSTGSGRSSSKIENESNGENSEKSISDSDADSGSESEKSEVEKTVSPVQPYKPLPQVILKDPEEERKENLRQKMDKIVKLFERRNSEEDIEAARQRYLMRKRAGLIKPVFCKE